MKMHQVEKLMDSAIKEMNLSHYKEVLPFIFESLGISEYYSAFQEWDDVFKCDTDNTIHCTYHNKVHATAVALNCFEATESTITQFSREDMRALMLAALYHDYKHAKIIGDDFINICAAIKGVNDIHKKVKRKVLPETLARALKLIKHTEYPYRIPSPLITDPLSLILRDADMMMVYEPTEISVNLLSGLLNEINSTRRNQDKPPMSITDFVSENGSFLRNIAWCTRWAKTKAYKRNLPATILNVSAKLINASNH